MRLKEIIPQYYSKNFFIRNLFWSRLKSAIQLAQEKLRDSPGIKIIDLGCGQGILLKLLEKNFKNIQIFGIDKEPSVLNIKKFLRADIRVADLRKSGFSDNFFDVVFCLDVLEHFQNLEEPVKEIKRIIKKDGFLVVSLPTENFFYRLGRFLTIGTTSMEKGPCSPHFYGAKTIEDFLSANNFKIIEKKLLPSIPYLPLFHIIAFKINNNK